MQVSQQSLLFLLAGLVVGFSLSQVFLLGPFASRESTLSALRKDVGDLKQMISRGGGTWKIERGGGTLKSEICERNVFPVKPLEDPHVIMSRAWENVKHPREMNAVEYDVPGMLTWLSSCKEYQSKYRSWPAQPVRGQYGCFVLHLSLFVFNFLFQISKRSLGLFECCRLSLSRSPASPSDCSRSGLRLLHFRRAGCRQRKRVRQSGCNRSRAAICFGWSDRNRVHQEERGEHFHVGVHVARTGLHCVL